MKCYPPEKCRIERTATTATLVGPSGYGLVTVDARASDSDLWHILDVINSAYVLGWDIGRSRMIQQMQALEEKQISTTSIQEAS
ncbi:hypothetical protein [Desulfobotulus sp.]|uniref:hypothetical protein n=1 Tax=Desulfobotulus sp. TaxID=1940337 RepID=UPI002A3608C3|nr:hypothetical protein [Desulfobotulus sp.]MDY0164623.1 hypothetical protein [Desulfobotulus sp.]